MKVRILKGDAIPTDKIKTGDVREFSESTAKGLIRLGIAEEVKQEKKADVTAEVVVPEKKKATRKPRKKKAE